MTETEATPAPRRITTLLVDDHLVLTDAIAALLGATPDIDIIGTADTLAACRALLASRCPQVIVLDVDLPDGDGLAFIPAIRQACPAAAILVLTSLSDRATLSRAVDSGVNGFVPKRRPLSELTAAIRQAANGEIVMPPSLLLGLLQQARARTAVPPNPLTPRERDLLALMARGQSSAEIAAALVISPATVRTHIGNIMVKLGAHSRLEAVAQALRRGWLEPPQ
jgi:DNA-binding NarL/FixJ family response regulator